MRLCLMVEGQEDVSWDDGWRSPMQASARASMGSSAPTTTSRWSASVTRASHDAWRRWRRWRRRTERIRLGTLVSPVTFRHPAVLAKSVATIDHVSGGRVELGLGAGWNEGEHAAYGFAFPPLGTRMELLEEQLEIVHRPVDRGLGDIRGPVTTGSRSARRSRSRCSSHARRSSSAAMRSRGAVALAVRLADEYNTLPASIDDCRERKSVLCRRASRPGATRRRCRSRSWRRASSARTGAGARPRARRARGLRLGDEDPRPCSPSARERWIAGTPDEVVERLHALAEAGSEARLSPASPAQGHGHGGAHRRSRPACVAELAVLRFRDRAEAGRELGERLAADYAGRSDVVVLALPRGGVAVGREVADILEAPLDVLVVRKLGFPGQAELAMRAIASGGARVLNEALLAQTGVPPDRVDAVVARELDELRRREQLYRGNRPAPTSLA